MRGRLTVPLRRTLHENFFSAAESLGANDQNGHQC